MGGRGGGGGIERERERGGGAYIIQSQIIPLCTKKKEYNM